jgi:hypothetical protein
MLVVPARFHSNFSLELRASSSRRAGRLARVRFRTSWCSRTGAVQVSENSVSRKPTFREFPFSATE